MEVESDDGCYIVNADDGDIAFLQCILVKLAVVGIRVVVVVVGGDVVANRIPICAGNDRR